MADIFIAYSRQDSDIALKLRDHFESLGWSVFIDVGIHAGVRFSQEIEQQLDDAHAVVVLWSNHSKNSDYVLDEAREAKEADKLFPARIENTRLPFGYGGLQTPDVIEWDGSSDHSGVGQLVDALNNRLGNASLRTREVHTDTGSVDIAAEYQKLRNAPDVPLGSAPESGQIITHPLASGGTGPEMVAIPAGDFWMGSKDGEGLDDERPRHRVTFDKPFLLGRYAVTFEDYGHFCDLTGARTPRADFGRGKQPVINVSWRDAMAYCDWLSRDTGQVYTLPSEAQWEYACRAGTETPWHTGQKLDITQANIRRYNNGTVAVDEYEPNGFGLHQMHGNVWEWCADAWHDRHDPDNTNGVARVGKDNGVARVLRGGAWHSLPHNCRLLYRGLNYPDNASNNLGFRVSCASPI